MHDDIRWSTLCHHANDLMNSKKMKPEERIDLGAYIVASVVKNMPEKDRFRWFAHAMREISSQSGDLNVLPVVAEKVL